MNMWMHYIRKYTRHLITTSLLSSSTALAHDLPHYFPTIHLGMQTDCFHESSPRLLEFPEADTPAWQETAVIQSRDHREDQQAAVPAPIVGHKPQPDKEAVPGRRPPSSTLTVLPPDPGQPPVPPPPVYQAPIRLLESAPVVVKSPSPPPRPLSSSGQTTKPGGSRVLLHVMRPDEGEPPRPARRQPNPSLWVVLPPDQGVPPSPNTTVAAQPSEDHRSGAAAASSEEYRAYDWTAMDEDAQAPRISKKSRPSTASNDKQHGGEDGMIALILLPSTPSWSTADVVAAWEEAECRLYNFVHSHTFPDMARRTGQLLGQLAGHATPARPGGQRPEPTSAEPTRCGAPQELARENPRPVARIRLTALFWENEKQGRTISPVAPWNMAQVLLSRDLGVADWIEGDLPVPSAAADAEATTPASVPRLLGKQAPAADAPEAAQAEITTQIPAELAQSLAGQELVHRLWSWMHRVLNELPKDTSPWRAYLSPARTAAMRLLDVR
ncbi:MAG: hypothetical protein KatS3mg111_1099 [Pirellulaceae bacterium]|nr:MAG: hypothetical protein KatS3mg111_1099 [Pirellulaceae bacterium]